MIYLENYSTILELTGLFKGIKIHELRSMMNCLGSRIQNVKKGETVLLSGDRLEYIGVALSGLLHITRENYDGNRSVLAVIKQGGVFAEVLCCAGITESPVTIIAAEDSIIIKLSFARVFKTCSSSCSFHARLIENMAGLIAKKNLILQSRMEILELKTIRDKVMRYLETFNTRNITLPFNRGEMADFLCVERSALSHELTKMKKDGLIDYKLNKFRFS